MELGQVVSVLQKFCPQNLAETIDNVGLLIEPSRPHNVKNILVMNSVSEELLDQAISRNVNLIVAYNPLIFTPFKRLTQSHWRERCIIKCIENKIAVFSPHTSIDSKGDGINDYLLSPFKLMKKVSINPPQFIAEDICESSAAFDDNFKKFSLLLPLAPIAVDVRTNNGREARFKYPRSQKENVESKAVQSNVKILSTTISKRPEPVNEGAGRVGYLGSKETIASIIEKYKQLFGIKSIEISLGARKKIQDAVTTVAVCAGSGGGLLTHQPPAMLADVLITGETSYQEDVETQARGVTILKLGNFIAEHHYLMHKLMPFMKSELSGVNIEMARIDTKPTQII